MQTNSRSSKARKHLYKNTPLLLHINSSEKHVLKINPFIFAGIKTFSSVARGQIRFKPHTVMACIPFHTHIHTHTPKTFKRKVTLKKNTSKIHVEDDYKNPQPDKQTPGREHRQFCFKLLGVYLADSRVNVSYVSRDMCISYPVSLQLRHSPHRPTNTD